MHQKHVFMIRIRICGLHFETKKVLSTDFVWLDMNDVTIPHALCIEKNIVYYVISFRAYMDSEYHSLVIRAHRITLCDINTIKTDNIGGYIINIYYYNCNLIRSAGSRQVDRYGSPDQTRRGALSLIY